MPKHVLVADDNTAVRQFMRNLLEHEAIVCSEAGDGVEAVEKAQKLRPDLVVLDLAMPRLNGAEAASILHARMPKTPIIIFTM